MLANIPDGIILLICEYPEFKDLGQLAWTNKRMMQIIKRYLPIAIERKTLFYRKKLHWKLRDFETIRNNLVRCQNYAEEEGRIYLFNSLTGSVEEIAKFDSCYAPYQVATTQDKVNSYARYFE